MQIGDLVAVYGTLRDGCGNHHRLEGAEREPDGIIAGQFGMVSLGGFPGLVKEVPNHDVVVEVYKVESEQRKRGLDALEGYYGENHSSNFYDREQVQLTDGRTVWVYTLPENYSGYARVTSGDWKNYRLGGH